MKTEDYLQLARDMNFRLIELEKERLDVMSNMVSIKSASDYSDRVQSSPRSASRCTSRPWRLSR